MVQRHTLNATGCGGRMKAIRFARIVLPLCLALALASCASSPAPGAPHAATARDVQPFNPSYNFTEAQSAPFTLSPWDAPAPPSPTPTRYYRYPDYYRYYQYYALSSAIACLLTGMTVGVLWLLGWW
jgi:hypothetical protein